MAKEPPQPIGNMCRKAIVTDAEIAEAVEAYSADPNAGPFEFASGHLLDVSAVVNEYQQPKAIMADKGSSSALRRTMVHTAVILATPKAK